VLTHIWSMSFIEEATTEQREAFIAAMSQLPAKIAGVESFRSGTDLGLNPGNSDVAIVAEFPDGNAWKAYIEAPAHVAFVENHVIPLCAAWGAIQFGDSSSV
jgi:hypothetical protein